MLVYGPQTLTPKAFPLAQQLSENRLGCRSTYFDLCLASNYLYFIMHILNKYKLIQKPHVMITNPKTDHLDEHIHG